MLVEPIYTSTIETVTERFVGRLTPKLAHPFSTNGATRHLQDLPNCPFLFRTRGSLCRGRGSGRRRGLTRLDRVDFLSSPASLFSVFPARFFFNCPIVPLSPHAHCRNLWMERELSLERPSAQEMRFMCCGLELLRRVCTAVHPACARLLVRSAIRGPAHSVGKFGVILYMSWKSVKKNDSPAHIIKVDSREISLAQVGPQTIVNVCMQ